MPPGRLAHKALLHQHSSSATQAQHRHHLYTADQMAIAFRGRRECGWPQTPAPQYRLDHIAQWLDQSHCLKSAQLFQSTQDCRISTYSEQQHQTHHGAHQ